MGFLYGVSECNIFLNGLFSHKVLQINEQFFRGQWSILGERTGTCNQTDNTYLKGDRRSLIYMFTELFELML